MHKVALLALAIGIPALAEECSPYKPDFNVIPAKRIIKGIVEKCSPDGKWVTETEAPIYTKRDLVAAANQAFQQGQDKCVEFVKDIVSEKRPKP